MTWQDQGRQEHGYFGHGTSGRTAPPGGGDAAVFGPDGLGARIDRIAATMLAHVKPDHRNRVVSLFSGTGRDALRRAMVAWSTARRLDDVAFRTRFLLPWTSDAVVVHLREATAIAADAQDHRDLARASDALGKALKEVGVNLWPRFISAAEALAGVKDSGEGGEGGAPATGGESTAAPATRTDQLPGGTGSVAPRASSRHTGRTSPPPKPDSRAVPFVDDDGQPVLDDDGKPMMRPNGLLPGDAVRRGLADRQGREEIRDGYKPEVFARVAELIYEAWQLSAFKHYGSSDAQRIGGVYHPDFVNYSTVLIGLYAAANGIDLDQILNIEAFYAHLFSNFVDSKGNRPPMNDRYPDLPQRNVNNTKRGYELFQSGKVTGSGK